MKIDRKLKVSVVGATGFVGQRFVTLLADHPWFEIVAVTASPRSEGKTYEEAVEGRWKIDAPIPENVASLVMMGTDDVDRFCDLSDLVFCAVDMEKEPLISLEEAIAKREVPVVSNNSANRWTPDVPMVLPEVNPHHLQLIEAQKKRLNTTHGFIVVKPNCSIQSYVPALAPLMDFVPESMFVSTYQAVSGAGKTLADWPEMNGNVIPFISGEEEKSELEPLKIWGEFAGDHIELAKKPLISAQCYRVPVLEGHMAAVYVKFRKSVDQNEILMRWREYSSLPQELDLPSAPKPFLRYLDDFDRPQPVLDALSRNGMGIAIGRLREDPIYDYKFTCLSHNTLRGAAGGAILTAELMLAEGYIGKR